MNKHLKVLGDGQIWDVKGILPQASGKTFEDLFSGRALAQMAKEFNQQPSKGKRIFSAFKEKGKITGLSVTKALLSNDKRAKETARILLEDLAKNAARGIAVLNAGKGFKENWSNRERNYWRNLDFIIIGGGVSEGLTGRILVSLIKKYLSQDELSDIKVSQAKFPGKEAGFLGAVINIIRQICNEAKIKSLKVISAIGLDLGREEIGAGLLAINPRLARILKQKKHYWLFKYAVKTPYKNYLKNFVDARRDYTISERRLGERIRCAILEQMADLIIRAQNKTRKIGLPCAQNVGVAVPGSTSYDGYIINSTDYLPFFRKEDGFNFAKNLEESLIKSGMRNYRIHIINDGIAAGIANIYFDPSTSLRVNSERSRTIDLSKLRRGKCAFLGAGSGLGGCVGVINTI